MNNPEVICCFCGNKLEIQEAIILTAQLNINCEEVQCFFAHKQHFVEVIDKTIPLHPDFFEEKKE